MKALHVLFLYIFLIFPTVVLAGTDSDFVPDSSDLDDDNDGILDTQECPAVDSGITGALTDLSFSIDSDDPNQNGGIHTLVSITIANSGSALLDGTYDDLIVPSSYVSNFSNLSLNDVREANGAAFEGDLFQDTAAVYDSAVLDAFTSFELSHMQQLGSKDFRNDSYRLNYDVPVNSTAGGFIAITERGGNNDTIVEAFNANNDSLGSVTARRNTSDFVDTGHQANNASQNIELALFPIENLASVGSQIAYVIVTFGANSNGDAPDGKIFFYTDFETVVTSCDSDNDGISNRLDLDSDNDGIADIYEAGNASVYALDTNGNGVIELSEGFVDDGVLADSAAGNGLDDRIENLIGTAGSGVTPVDSELTPDTIVDYLDLDSDDDGIPDVVEGRPLADYPEYPATIDTAADSDDDGILDIFDDSNGTFGSTDDAFISTLRPPPNTDAGTTSDSIPDYLDTDSDEDTLTDNAEATDLVAAPSASDPDGSITDEASILTLLGNSDSDNSDADFRSQNDADGDGIPDATDTNDTDPCVPNLPSAACLDSDGDGVPNAATIGTSLTIEVDSSADTNPCNPNAGGLPVTKDCDGDGLNVTQEGVAGTDVADADTDGDGNPDGLDSNPTTLVAGDDIIAPGVAVNILSNDDYLPNSNSSNAGTTTLSQVVGGSCVGTTIFDANAGTVSYVPGIGENSGGGCTFNYEVCNNESGSAVCQTATVTVNLPDGDDDGDGVANSAELDAAAAADPCLPNADGLPLTKDCDGDGLNVTQENAAGTSTSDADTDGDGNPDNLDANPSIATAVNDVGSSGVAINILANDDYLPNNDSNNAGVTTLTQAAGGTCSGLVNFDDTLGTLTYTLSGSELGSSCTVNYEVCNDESAPALVCQIATVTISLVTDGDGDGVLDVDDLDRDNDGIPDSVEGTGDTDGDGIPDNLDRDSDNDGIPDLVESGLSEADIAALDTDNDGEIDASNTFGDNGLADAVETAADAGNTDYDGDGAVDSPVDTDGDGVADFRDIDKDNDAIPDLYESGLSANDIASLDADGDGQIDPPSQTAANVVGGDGIADDVQDGNDGGSLDYMAADTDSDNVADALDLDSDNDGVPDLIESGLPLADIGDLDTDRDGRIDPPSQTATNTVGDDGVVDSVQVAGVDGAAIVFTPLNTDGDTVNDYRDLDSDNDGLLDLIEADLVDSDGNGQVDGNVDANGIVPNGFVDSLTIPDADADGIPDGREIDSDNQGNFDIADASDPIIRALDGDGDGIIDGSDDPANDPDGDGIYGLADPAPDVFAALGDSDNDGISDSEEQNGDPARDTDGDGTPDFLDTDSDNDGFTDELENNADCVNPDGSDATDDGDCDNNGVLDRLENNELITAVDGAGSTGWYLILMTMLVLVIRAMPAFSKGFAVPRGSSKLFTMLGVVCLANALFTVETVNAHDNYSARYVMPDAEEEWVKYDKDVHGDADTDVVKEQRKFNPGYYLGLGLGSTHVDPEGESNGFVTDDDSSDGFKIYVGRHFKPHWAWELSYSDLGEAGLGNPTNATLAALVPNAEIDYGVPAFWIKYLPLNPNSNFSLDVKAGIAAITNSANDSRIGFEKQTSAQLALGLGAQVRFARRFFARLDIDSYDKDATYTGLSVGVYFGGHDEHGQSKPISDSDQDGVVDAADDCLETPAGIKVDVTGCAILLDADSDGIADANDQCPNSLATDTVDARGCVPAPVVNCAAFTGVTEGVNFKTNSAELTASAKQVLRGVSAIFKANPGARIEVQAHTDSQGSESYNLNLSSRRAASVRGFLIDLGIDGETLLSRGYGEAQPVASNATAAGRAQNRRVTLQPLDKVCQ